jgi:hypothetical protein
MMIFIMEEVLRHELEYSTIEQAPEQCLESQINMVYIMYHPLTERPVEVNKVALTWEAALIAARRAMGELRAESHPVEPVLFLDDTVPMVNEVRSLLLYDGEPLICVHAVRPEEDVLLGTHGKRKMKNTPQ